MAKKRAAIPKARSRKKAVTRANVEALKNRLVYIQAVLNLAIENLPEGVEFEIDGADMGELACEQIATWAARVASHGGTLAK